MPQRAPVAAAPARISKSMAAKVRHSAASTAVALRPPLSLRYRGSGRSPGALRLSAKAVPAVHSSAYLSQQVGHADHGAQTTADCFRSFTGGHYAYQYACDINHNIRITPKSPPRRRGQGGEGGGQPGAGFKLPCQDDVQALCRCLRRVSSCVAVEHAGVAAPLRPAAAVAAAAASAAVMRMEVWLNGKAVLEMLTVACARSAQS